MTWFTIVMCCLCVCSVKHSCSGNLEGGGCTLLGSEIHQEKNSVPRAWFFCGLKGLWWSWILALIFKNYLFIWKLQKDRDRQRSAICWFTSEMEAVAGAGSGWIQDPGAPVKSHVDYRGPHIWALLHYCLCCISRELNWKWGTARTRAGVQMGY